MREDILHFVLIIMIGLTAIFGIAMQVTAAPSITSYENNAPQDQEHVTPDHITTTIFNATADVSAPASTAHIHSLPDSDTTRRRSIHENNN